MSEDRMIHKELKSRTSKKQKDERHSTHKSGVFPRYVIAVNLGILCFLVLLKAMGLGYLFVMMAWRYQMKGIYYPEVIPEGVFQFSSCYEIQDKKDTSEKSTFSPETQAPSVLPPTREKGCDIHEGQWSCCGRSCYYFSTKEKTWKESKKKCQKLHSNLIKIDDEEEQRFIQSKIKYDHWVGLQKKPDKSWLWQDGSSPSGKLNFQETTSTSDAACGRVKKTLIINGVCTNVLYYICEKHL
ncbi:C-type lectin domain family 7 member A-like isoform X2 [Talpa occidentalis]|uniref:C-type lectin domain family 7 member A-like isoform X2 n=1 Tax=Talpa occidentalis TaxID=50954 RepID=UPI0023F80B10|nr:C-type lectin domain family 7 member A-like isoform X2 [Talpa occidentalis]